MMPGMIGTLIPAKSQLSNSKTMLDKRDLSPELSSPSEGIGRHRRKAE